jgi:Tfp pilus assembly protein PilF
VSPRIVRLLLAGLAVLPHLGCLTAGPGHRQALTDPADLTGSGPAAKEVDLPPDKSARACLRVAQDMEKNGFPVEAVFYYEKARHDDPNLKQVARRLGVLYDRLGEPKRALEEYQLALKLTPRDANLLNDIGYYYYNLGKWDKAEEHLRKAIASNAKHNRAWVNLGLTLGQQRRYDDSLQAFQHATSEAEAHSNMAFVYATQGKQDEAKAEYRKALALEPALRTAQLALARLENPRPAAKSKGPDTPPDAQAGHVPAADAGLSAERHAKEEKAAAAPCSPGPAWDLARLLGEVAAGPARTARPGIAEALPTPPPFPAGGLPTPPSLPQANGGRFFTSAVFW